jgi:hypothetical protein
MQTTMIRRSAWTGAALVLAMIGLYFATGVGQDPLQFFHLPTDYAAILLKNPAALRAVITLDDLFVVAYTIMFLGLFARLKELKANALLTHAGAVCMLLLAAFDMLENFHFMTMLAAAEQHILPSLGHIQLQITESLFKFHTGYLGTFLLGLAIPRDKPGLRALAFACCWISLPVGVLIYAVPPPYNTVFLFGRFGFFLYALISIGWLFGAPRVPPTPSALGTNVLRAATGSSAPA